MGRGGIKESLSTHCLTEGVPSPPPPPTCMASSVGVLQSPSQSCTALGGAW